MAEIRPLTRRMSAEGAERLTVALAQAVEAGEDLGPRKAQIQCLGLSLGSMATALRAALSRLDRQGLGEDPRWSTDPRLVAVLVEAERLAALARAYPDPPSEHRG